MDEIFAERIITTNDSVRLLDQIVEEVDLAALWNSCKLTGGKPATNPVTLFKVMVYASIEAICSSKSIPTACRRDISFIWLLEGEKASKQHEVARFRSQRLPECAEDLFYFTAD